MGRGYYTQHEAYLVMMQLLEYVGVFTLAFLVSLLAGLLLTRDRKVGQ